MRTPSLITLRSKRGLLTWIWVSLLALTALLFVPSVEESVYGGSAGSAVIVEASEAQCQRPVHLRASEHRQSVLPLVVFQCASVGGLKKQSSLQDSGPTIKAIEFLEISEELYSFPVKKSDFSRLSGLSPPDLI